MSEQRTGTEITPAAPALSGPQTPKDALPTIRSVTSAVIAARRVGDGYARFDSRQASAETPGGGALRKLRRVRSSDRIMKTSGRLVRTSSPKVTASPYSRAFVSRTPATPWPPHEGCEASESGAAGSHVADEAALSMGEEWPPSKPSGAACGGLRGVLGLRAGTSLWGLEPWDLRRWCLSHGWAGATCATCGSWPFLSSRLSWLELWWTPPKARALSPGGRAHTRGRSSDRDGSWMWGVERRCSAGDAAPCLTP